MNLSQEDLDLLHRTEKQLRQLSPERLRVASDFLAYLREREENEATEELVNIPGFEAELHEALQEAEDGDVIPFEQIRKERSLQEFEDHQRWLEQFRDRTWASHSDSTQIIRQMRESDGVDS
jgi:hypothetical protein